MTVYEKLNAAKKKAAEKGESKPLKAKKAKKMKPAKAAAAATEGAAIDTDAATPQAAPATQASVIEFMEPSQWVERMALTAVKTLPEDLQPDDDPKREEVFIQQALLSVNRGIELLEKASVPWKRPDDFYAEMYKDDVQMSHVRRALEASKARIEERAHRRSMKDQKAFGKEVQAEVLRQRAQHKRDLDSKLTAWRKKNKGNRSEALNDLLDDEDGGGRGGRGGRRGGGGGRGGKGQQRPRNLRPGGSSKRPGKNARHRK